MIEPPRAAVTQMLGQRKLRALSEARVDHPNAYSAIDRAFQHEGMVARRR